VPEKKVRYAEFKLDFGRFPLYRVGRPFTLEGLRSNYRCSEQISDELGGR